MRFLPLPPLLAATALLKSLPQAPAFEIPQPGSTIRFNVKASVAIAGKFDK